jgi:hypothetical protein
VSCECPCVCVCMFMCVHVCARTRVLHPIFDPKFPTRVLLWAGRGAMTNLAVQGDGGPRGLLDSREDWSRHGAAPCQLGSHSQKALSLGKPSLQVRHLAGPQANATRTEISPCFCPEKSGSACAPPCPSPPAFLCVLGRSRPSWPLWWKGEPAAGRTLGGAQGSRGQHPGHSSSAALALRV